MGDSDLGVQNFFNWFLKLTNQKRPKVTSFNTDLLQCTMQNLFKTKQLNVVSEVFIEFKNSLLFFSLFFFLVGQICPNGIKLWNEFFPKNALVL